LAVSARYRRISWFTAKVLFCVVLISEFSIRFGFLKLLFFYVLVLEFIAAVCLKKWYHLKILKLAANALIIQVFKCFKIVLFFQFILAIYLHCLQFYKIG
jgi:hypothetical protein